MDAGLKTRSPGLKSKAYTPGRKGQGARETDRRFTIPRDTQKSNRKGYDLSRPQVLPRFSSPGSPRLQIFVRSAKSAQYREGYMTQSASVVMAVWNGATYLGEAIRSVLEQSFSDFARSRALRVGIPWPIQQSHGTRTSPGPKASHRSCVPVRPAAISLLRRLHPPEPWEKTAFSQSRFGMANNKTCPPGWIPFRPFGNQPVAWMGTPTGTALRGPRDSSRS